MLYWELFEASHGMAGNRLTYYSMGNFAMQSLITKEFDEGF